MTSLIDPRELDQLTLKYGEPVHRAVTFQATFKFLQERRKALKKRRGEVVLVLPRPGGHVLLHIKSFYPQGCWRLPSGGIEIGEAVEHAADREIREETGLPVHPDRFLGLIEYRFNTANEFADWASYVFQTGESDDAPITEDSNEQITGFVQIPFADLGKVAAQLRQLPPDWQEWGQFRALQHDLVAEVLK